MAGGPRIVHNATGDHIKRNIRTGALSLLTRWDVYPEYGTPAWQYHHVWIPGEPVPEWVLKLVDPETVENAAYEKAYAEWFGDVKKVERDNPMLCWFTAVPEAVKSADLLEGVRQIFEPGLVATLDYYTGEMAAGRLPVALSHIVSPLMRGKAYSRDVLARAYPEDYADRLAALKVEMGGLAVDLVSGGVARTVEPESITMGNAAIVRDSTVSCGYTRINSNNPASADGTLDTTEVYLNGNVTGLYAGTVTDNGGDKYTPRDYQLIGNVLGGSKQIISVELNTVSGDEIAFYAASGGGSIYSDTTGGTAIKRTGSGNYLTGGQFDIYFTATSFVMSLYATGTESGGAVPMAAISMGYHLKGVR